jgi:hypothetical protein
VSCGKSDSTRTKSGVATLYGRFAMSRADAPTIDPMSASIASATTSETFVASSTTSRRISAICVSISMQTTRCAASDKATVREPRPGPISRTVSSGCTSAIRTIRRTVLGSTRKC